MSDQITDPVYVIANWFARFENNRSAELRLCGFVALPNALDADEYLEILDHEDGVRHWSCWVSLLMVASRCGIPAGGCDLPGKLRGPLLRDTCYPGTRIRRPHDAESLARSTRMPRDVMAVALARFVDLGLIERKSPDTQGLLAFMLAPDTPRSQGAAARSQGGAEKSQVVAKKGREWKGTGKEQKRDLQAQPAAQAASGVDAGASSPAAPPKQDEPARKSARKDLEFAPNGVWGNPPIQLDTRTQQFVGITEKERQRWDRAYPNVDIDRALAQMVSWCLTHGTKGMKTYYDRFIERWLASDQQSGRNPRAGSATSAGAGQRFGANGQQPQRRADREFPQPRIQRA